MRSPTSTTTSAPPVEWLAPGTARVTARLPVADLEELFGVKVDAEDVETVGGLLAHELGRVPIAGSEATVAGLHLTAENLAGRRNKLGTVLIERVPAKDRKRTKPQDRSRTTSRYARSRPVTSAPAQTPAIRRLAGAHYTHPRE